MRTRRKSKEINGKEKERKKGKGKKIRARDEQVIVAIL